MYFSSNLMSDKVNPKNALKRAGKRLAEKWPCKKTDPDFIIVDEYRRSHFDPLNKTCEILEYACQETLTTDFITSQRIKRMPTILEKIKSGTYTDLTYRQSESFTRNCREPGVGIHSDR